MPSPTRGDARFTYDPGGGTVTVDLQWPVFGIRAGSRRRRFVTDSLDLANREVLTAGTGVRELIGRIRFHDDAAELLDLLEAGADGVTLNYIPSVAAGTSYPCTLVSPGGDALEVLRDQSDWGDAGSTEVPIVLRRNDGGNFDAMF